MSVAFVYDDRFLTHDTGLGHPERPDRLRAITSHFRETGLAARLTPLAPQPIDPIALERIHDLSYVGQVQAACRDAPARIEADTVVSPKSHDVALLAAGAAVTAADAIMRGDILRAFCAVRPPGHHAERDRAMGFCLFNNIAIAADHLTHAHNLKRVAIVDFDVHHGNGTQHAFEDRADVLFISIHEDPVHLYPGTGIAHEIGRGPGEGFTLNIPMPPGSTDADYAAAFDNTIIPRLREYQPEILLISAGFDASAADPLAHIKLTAAAFGDMTRKLAKIADEFSAGRILSVLEGGYDLHALAEGAAEHVLALLENAQEPR